MAYLPPVGWADVVTKRDLDALRNEMNLLATLTIMAAMLGVVVAAVKL